MATRHNERCAGSTSRCFGFRTFITNHTQHERCVATPCGFGVYADRIVRAEDKEARLRLCRYLSRPPLLYLWFFGHRSIQTRRADSTPVLGLTRLITARANTAVLCAFVPPPRFHLLRFFGVLSAHSSLRAQVAPGSSKQNESATAQQLVLPGLGLGPEPANCNAGRANAGQPKRRPRDT